MWVSSSSVRVVAVLFCIGMHVLCDTKPKGLYPLVTFYVVFGDLFCLFWNRSTVCLRVYVCKNSGCSCFVVVRILGWSILYNFAYCSPIHTQQNVTTKIASPCSLSLFLYIGMIQWNVVKRVCVLVNSFPFLFCFALFCFVLPSCFTSYFFALPLFIWESSRTSSSTQIFIRFECCFGRIISPYFYSVLIPWAMVYCKHLHTHTNAEEWEKKVSEPLTDSEWNCCEMWNYKHKHTHISVRWRSIIVCRFTTYTITKKRKQTN